MSVPPSDESTQINIAMPLYGGATAYMDTLEQVLEFVEIATPAEDKLVQWFKTNFPNVSSDDSIIRRVRFLQSLQFIVKEDDAFVLGPAGRRVQATSAPDTLYNILRVRITGFGDILEYLCQGQVEITTLIESLDQDYDQVKWKINWLQSIGFANQVEGDSYTATDAGRDAFHVYEVGFQ